MDKFNKWFKEKHIPFCEKMNEYVHSHWIYELIDKHKGIYKSWVSIDRKKDKSLSANDFKLYLYLRLVEKHKYG